jgi:hypothetical protein
VLSIAEAMVIKNPIKIIEEVQGVIPNGIKLLVNLVPEAVSYL